MDMTQRQPGRPPHNDILTPAEWRVAEQVRHGLTNPRIAARMGVSVDAVKFHVGNILSKLGLDNRQSLQRWTGISATSALSGRSRIMADGDDYMMLGQVARTTKDHPAALAWYRDVLGLPELYTFGNLSFFDLGGVRLMLGEEDGSGRSESILYLRVPDIHLCQASLEARGVAFTHAPHMVHRHQDGTEEWMAFFEDNEGRPLALMMQIRSHAS